MAKKIENNLIKLKDSNIAEPDANQREGNNDNSSPNDNNLREYEQLVILKKYPYLDLKDFDQKYRSVLLKNARQSEKFFNSHPDLENEPSICEAVDEGPNVEIFNRGLSGFSIPFLKYRNNLLEKNEKKNEPTISNINSQLSPELQTLNGLKEDILQYENKKLDKV